MPRIHSEFDCVPCIFPANCLRISHIFLACSILWSLRTPDYPLWYEIFTILSAKNKIEILAPDWLKCLETLECSFYLPSSFPPTSSGNWYRKNHETSWPLWLVEGMAIGPNQANQNPSLSFLSWLVISFSPQVLACCTESTLCTGALESSTVIPHSQCHMLRIISDDFYWLF